ncbi:hypothetical protein CEXT_269781 [Caerostris extrusa]|uniref:Uncharacterized protein n=1 Tax=Caerostris extrusa TaxID=172846 RepID=A0AAV4PJQ3_CAEEX|nr:hypothetical protein CEXT_269781 [Caerostris extrusa]
MKVVHLQHALQNVCDRCPVNGGGGHPSTATEHRKFSFVTTGPCCGHRILSPGQWSAGSSTPLGTADPPKGTEAPEKG